MLASDPGASSITVAVRVRPFTIREAAQLVKVDDGTLFLGDGSLAGAPTPKLNQRGIRSVIKVVDDRCLVFDPPEDNPVQKFSRSVVPMGKKVKDQVFAFDRIFDENATQIDVYEGTTKGLLDSVLDGYNATVFAYGATGCGKTHTITGTSQHPGIIFMTMQELFEKINERSDDKVTELSLSYLEIYNETIRDLLVPGGSKQGLMLREDSHQAVTVSGLTSHHPKDVQEVMDMIVQGNEYRTVSPTEANAVSSRSHAVLQINVAQRDRNAAVSEPHTMATLSIIDLAGSERASATKNRGERLIEGANINKSLLALGSCINALCDPRKRNHVPYRNSKLTRLLKFSLGGNCKTVMIVCVSPSSAHFDETQNTLRYANRAKNIQTKVTRNVFNVNRHVKDFLVKIDEQMALINELRAQQKDAENLFLGKFRKQQEKREAAAREGILRLRAAYDNALPERQEKVAAMKRLRAFERRIGLLSAWVAAFDTVCDARADGDDAAMPANLAAVRKTAQGILAELEHSRQHMHQKLERAHWERALDSALQHSLEQLIAAGDGVADGGSGERDTLAREAELLRSNFLRDAHAEVLEQERAMGGDAALLQGLLAAQFDMLASLSETLNMSEDEAVLHAKGIIHRLLRVGCDAVAQVVKPDGSRGAIPVVEAFPPSRRGTPKRKKPLAMNSASLMTKPTLAPPTFAAMLAAQQQQQQQQVFASPVVKGSPRRRKAGPARLKGLGVSFTPVKKKSPSKRMVRWRDDETEEGTLADFEKTPKRFAEDTPEQSASSPPEKMGETVPAVPTFSSGVESDESSPSLPPPPPPPPSPPPEITSMHVGRPSRFQAGFLSKSSRGQDEEQTTNPRGSPIPPPGLSPSLPASSSSPTPSDNEGKGERSSTPLRSIPVSRAANAFSPPNYIRNLHSHTATGSPKPSPLSVSTSALPVDENNLPLRRQRTSAPVSISASASCSAAGSDSESTPSAAVAIDAHKLRSALHSAKRRERLSSIGGGSYAASSGARRVSSSAGYHQHHQHHQHRRPSTGYSGGAALASSSNGISRLHRRGSAERRRSPPIACSPDSSFTAGAGTSGAGAGTSRAFTPGQARRMNLGGSVRWDGCSPRDRERLLGGGSRRVTIGSAALAGGGMSSGTVATAAVAAAAAAAAVGNNNNNSASAGPGSAGRAQRTSVVWR